ncbi:MAG TPA: HAMP domain-containing sensor histidine kinase [Euzebyales bacterium]
MRRRLVAVTLATTLTVAIAFVVPLAVLVRILATDRALDDADRAARTLIPVLVTGDRAAAEVAREQVAATSSADVTIILPGGAVLGPPVAETDLAAARRGSGVDRAAADGSRIRLTPVVGQEGTSVIQVVVPTASLTAGVGTAWLTLTAVGLALVGIAVVIADRLGRRAVAQASGVAAAARRLAAGESTARAPAADLPELDAAARALNTLADRIDALVAAEREAAADVSHRLRTPMTALRLDVDALPASAATERVIDDLAALDVAVDQVIRATRGGGEAPHAWTDAGRVVGERSAFWSALAADEQRPWSCTRPDETLPVAVDEERLAAVLDALLGNVLTHTDPPAGCRIAVDHVDGRVRIRIDDDGAGIPPGAARRGRSGGGSTGLGLDIARRTAESAGGSLLVGRGDHGGGRVDLLLPLSESEGFTSA